jgi:carnitine O-acetyltransferase
MKPPLSATNLRQMLSNASSGASGSSTTTSASTSRKGGGITYSKQDTLPLLPIPDLDITLQRLHQRLDALQQNEQQRQQTARDIQEFLATDGPILYEKLREYEENGRASGMIGSYVEEFWNEAYLQPDMSVVLNLNPYFVLESSPDPKMATNQLRRAASLTYAAIQMVSITKLELLVPDTFRNQPLCMHQFKSLFASSRQPTLHEMDDVHVFNDSTHGTL